MLRRTSASNRRRLAGWSTVNVSAWSVSSRATGGNESWGVFDGSADGSTDPPVQAARIASSWSRADSTAAMRAARLPAATAAGATASSA